jgi:hypothetical protein
VSVESKAFESLICNVLRGPHIFNMCENDLKKYIYEAGVALHNIPHNIDKGIPLFTDQIIGISQLDPSSNDTYWGDWVNELVPVLIPSLPKKK